jgi:hypothetical protein
MSHFAQINDQYIVQRVLVITQEEVNTGNWGDPASWIQTSYNTRSGIYYTPNSDPYVPDPDQSKAFRKNYAGIGDMYLAYGPDGEGFVPPSPYPSWVMNSFSYTWEAPVPMPVPNNPPYYQWDEATVSWVEVPAPPSANITEPGAAPNVIG